MERHLAGLGGGAGGEELELAGGIGVDLQRAVLLADRLLVDAATALASAPVSWPGTAATWAT